MTKTAADKKFVPLFPGTDPKTTMREQRQYCLGELGAGAKRLAEIENELAKIEKLYKEASEALEKLTENYKTLRGPETPIVKLDEFQYAQIQYRDFTKKCADLEKQIALMNKAAAKERKACENMRKNVIYLEERLSQDAKVIPFYGDRGQRLEG